MEEKTMSNETLKTVMIKELVSERKNSILVKACWKFSQVTGEGKDNGFARMSYFNFTELTKTKKNGKK